MTPPWADRIAAAASDTGVLPFVVALAKKYLPAFESDLAMLFVYPIKSATDCATLVNV